MFPTFPYFSRRSSKWGCPTTATTASSSSSSASAKHLIGGCDDLGLTPEERAFNVIRCRLTAAQLIGVLIGRLALAAPLTPTDASPFVAISPLCQQLTFFLDVANSRSAVQKYVNSLGVESGLILVMESQGLLKVFSPNAL